MKAVLARGPNHVIVYDQELDGLDDVADGELLLRHGFNQVFEQFMEEGDEGASVRVDNDFVLDAELSELETHRLLVDVVVVDVDNHAALAVHVEHFLVCKWHSIRAEANDVLDAYNFRSLHILLLCLTRDGPIRFMEQIFLRFFRTIVNFKYFLI